MQTLRQPSIMLKTYTGEMISIEGVIMVSVKIDKQRAMLPLYVVKGASPHFSIGNSAGK